MKKRKEIGFDEMCREIEEKSPCVFRWPKLTPAQIEELEQMVAEYRKRIEHEDVCTGSEV